MKKILRILLALALLFIGIIALMVVPDERLCIERFIVLLLVSKVVFFVCFWAAWQLYRKGDMKFFD